MRTKSQRSAILSALALLFGVLGLGIPAASASTDTTPPTAPGNLHITDVTPYTVTLAWNPSTDNSGQVVYSISANGTIVLSTDRRFAGTSWTVDALTPQTAYTFTVTAVDPTGNASAASNAVTVTTPAVSPPPTPMNVHVVRQDGTNVYLSWDDYGDFLNNQWVAVVSEGGGSYAYTAKGSNGLWVPNVAAGKTHQLTVQLRDFRTGLTSGVSEPVAVTIPPSADVTPPTAPTNLRLEADDGMGGKYFVFDASSDDTGVADYIVTLTVGTTSTTWYTTSGAWGTFWVSDQDIATGVTFTVTAYDKAGNASPTATATF